MPNNLQQIKTILEASPLSPPEQEELTAFFTRSAEDMLLRPIVQLLTHDPDWARRLYDNYKAKQAAVDTDSPEMWEKIIQDEERMLREVIG